MYTKLFIFILFVIYSTSVFSHRNQTNSVMDPEIESLLKKAKFEMGTIVKGNDTIPASILVYSRKNRKYSHYYCIVKSADDSVRVYLPTEIDGYSVNNQKYIKQLFDGKFIFIEHREEGRVELYSRGPITTDSRVLFFLKFPTKKYYVVISPYDKSIDIQSSEDSRGEPMIIYRTNDIDSKFKNFVKDYFSDCTQVVNMVNSGFYTITDIPTVVRIYNACFEE